MSNGNREKDRFLIVLVGLISYGIILIGIVIGTFFIVRNLFEKKDAEVSSAVASDISDQAEETDEGPDGQDTEQPAGEAGNMEAREVDHTVSADSYLINGKLDYTGILFKPNKRDGSLKWNDLVFSKIENVKEPGKAPVNTYKMNSKRVMLTDDRLLEIYTYTGPDSADISKITTIEHCSDNLDVIDYYYDNGVINYAAQRSAVVDYPIDISSGKVTSRYYFDNDTLVKYSYCEDNKATVFNAASLPEYSQGTVDQYEYLEAEMINKAYITLNAAKTLENVQYIEGYILDEYDQALSDVSVKLYKSSDMTEAASAVTNGDGHYEMSIPCDDEETYVLSAQKNDFDEVRIYEITAKTGSGVYYVPTPRLTYSSDGAEYNIQIAVRDSVANELPITDATVSLRAGLNCREGDIIGQAALNEEGIALFTLQSGNYTARVSKNGYEDSYFNVIVTMSRQITVGYAVPDVPENKIQAVLAWDTAPLDLDARVLTAGGKNVYRAVSDGVGALTAETITLDVNDEEMYRYYVSDHTNCTGGNANSDSLTGSGARVSLYGPEGYIGTYDVPVGHLGVIWEPFAIRGREVLPVNHFYNVIEQDSYWTSK
ncbi:MAG: hypothetical protein K6A71_02965 [Lachnospiraceae bacterium]|nr:hypothetical protein [Lachnospiraceae bacterium]